VRDVWPSIRRAKPRATFCIVGRNPSAKLLRLGEAEGIAIAANVPDVRPYLAESAAVVVPLRIGGGTRIKIFEAMAMAKAVVSTSIGAEGLPVRPGEHLLLANNSEAFAAQVIELLNGPSKRKTMGALACELVRKHYSAETVARQFDDICRGTVDHLRGTLTCQPK
jgi:glycosyltransferase involved in cell wall biosynthesis